MLYVNISKERKLIPSKRVKKWVNPGEAVEVDSVDERFLGINASSLMPKEKYDRKMKRKARKARQRIKKIKALKAIKKAKVKAKAKAKTPKKEKKSIIKKVVDKVLPKKKAKAVTLTPKQLKAQRAKLKDALTDMNKKDLYNFGKDELDINSKWTDKKDSIY